MEQRRNEAFMFLNLGPTTVGARGFAYGLQLDGEDCRLRTRTSATTTVVRRRMGKRQ
ncbi:hypothetical protein ACLK19_15170 [Escherichia coli]